MRTPIDGHVIEKYVLFRGTELHTCACTEHKVIERTKEQQFEYTLCDVTSVPHPEPYCYLQKM